MILATRESVGAALFALLQNATGVTNAQRSYIDSTTLNAANLPALELVCKRERSEMRGPGIPIKWTLQYWVYLFASTESGGAETILNGLLDGIETALKPPPSLGRQTLGNLVFDCRINGEIVREPGFATGISAAAIPVEVTTTS
jgi:hypothetical protein